MRRRGILSRVAQTKATLARLNTIWKDKNIRIKHKIRLVRALVITVFLYVCYTPLNAFISNFNESKG